MGNSNAVTVRDLVETRKFIHRSVASVEDLVRQVHADLASTKELASLGAEKRATDQAATQQHSVQNVFDLDLSGLGVEERQAATSALDALTDCQRAVAALLSSWQ